MMMNRWGSDFGGGYMMGGHGMGIAGMILCVLFVAAVIVFAIYFIRRGHYRNFMFQKQEDSALTTLRERFAKGEIDSEEYQRRKEELLR